MESIIKNVLGITIISKEIECADRIVSQTGIYKAVVVSARAKECVVIVMNYPFNLEAVECERLLFC